MAPPAVGTTYLSDLQPIYAYTGFGTLSKDTSIGGNTITLNGVTYSKGIGTHAIGGHEYNLGGIVSRFQADVGVDDEVGSNGSVIFQVFADGLKIYDSGIMTGSSATKTGGFRCQRSDAAHTGCDRYWQRRLRQSQCR